jgi:hypothetical protein
MSQLIRPLGVAEILDGAFTLYRRHLGILLGLGMIFHALPALAALGSTTLAQVLVVFGGPFYDAALIFAAAELIQGRTVRPGAALSVGLRRFVPLWLLTIIFGVSFLPAMLVSGLAVFAGTTAVGIAGAASGGGALVAILSLPVIAMAALPIVWWLLSLFAWRQVVVVEGEWNIFRRSFSLARGGRRQILAVALIGWLLLTMATLPLGVGVLLSGDLDAIVSDADTGMEQPLSLVLLGFLATVLTRPFTHLLYTLLYFSRRVQVEGLDVERSVEDLESTLAQADRGEQTE